MALLTMRDTTQLDPERPFRFINLSQPFRNHDESETFCRHQSVTRITFPPAGLRYEHANGGRANRNSNKFALLH